MLRGYTTYNELQSSEEGIATNILANRLERLVEAGIIDRDADPADRRKVRYRLTQKGIDLARIIMAIGRWSLTHEPVRVPRYLADRIKASPDAFVADLHRRWLDQSMAPLLPVPDAASSKPPRKQRQRRTTRTATARGSKQRTMKA